MNTVLVVVVHVITDQSTKMLFVQRDDMVEDLAPATSHPAFRDPVLPGRLDARLLGGQPRRLQESDDVGVKRRVAVEEDVTVRASVGKGLPQLLNDPLGSRMACDVEVQDLPTSVFDDEEAVEELEGNRRHGEEVECNDHFAVILQEGQPVLAWITAALNASEVPSHASFGNDEAELLEFSVNLGRAPGRILFRQAADEPTDFSRSFRSAAARS